MKVLFLAPDIPYPLTNGGKIRTYHLIKRVAESHDVTLLSFDRTPSESGRADALRELCDEVHTVPLERRQTQESKRLMQARSLISRRPYHYYWAYSDAMQRLIDATVGAKQYDLIQVEFAQMGYYRLPDDVPMVLDQHNTEYDLLRRVFENETSPLRKLLAYAEWKKFLRDELAACRAADLCVTSSQQDRDLLSSQVPGRPFEVVPNGVDTDYFQPAVPDQAGPNTILFAGTIDYYPNTDGLTYFFDEILPEIRRTNPEIRVIVAGRNPPEAIRRHGDDPAVTVTGGVDDIRPYYHRAAVVFVPLRVGSGTRLKILEAMSMGRPIVSTSVGAEGIATNPEENIVLADTPETFAAGITRLLDDESLRGHIAGNARRLVTERYDWRVIGQALLDGYDKHVWADLADATEPEQSD